MVQSHRDVYARYSGSDEITPLSSPRNMLQADASMSYLDFIAMVKYLWERVHPEIPIRAVQSTAFEKLPVITYSLELRRPHQTEPKERVREEKVDSEGNIYTIKAQRFQNVVGFSVIDDNPEVAEAIIEEFEAFMFEYTPTLKQLGASDILYSRRVSDAEATRLNGDTNIRSVQYMVTLEKVRFIQEEKLQEVLVDVRLFLDNQRAPSFEVTTDQIGTPNVTILQNNLLIDPGDKFILRAIDNSLYTFPGGIISGYTYTVSSVEIDDSATPYVCSVALQDHNGIPVNFVSAGHGVIIHNISDNMSLNQQLD